MTLYLPDSDPLLGSQAQRQPGRYLDFDGVDDRCVLSGAEDVLDSPIPEAFAVAIWAYSGRGDADNRLLSITSGGGDASFYLSGHATNSLSVNKQLSGRITIDSDFAPNVWNHITFVAESSNAWTYYKNGYLHSTGDFWVQPLPNLPNAR